MLSFVWLAAAAAQIKKVVSRQCYRPLLHHLWHQIISSSAYIHPRRQFPGRQCFVNQWHQLFVFAGRYNWRLFHPVQFQNVNVPFILDRKRPPRVERRQNHHPRWIETYPPFRSMDFLVVQCPAYGDFSSVWRYFGW